MSNFKIELKGLRFNSRIGVSEQERKVGNEFVVDVAYSFPADRFVLEDLDSTISYAYIYEIVSVNMEQEWKLLESAALTIFKDIRRYFQNIKTLSVTITKTSVPVNGMDGSASVTIES